MSFANFTNGKMFQKHFANNWRNAFKQNGKTNGTIPNTVPASWNLNLSFSRFFSAKEKKVKCETFLPQHVTTILALHSKNSTLASIFFPFPAQGRTPSQMLTQRTSLILSIISWNVFKLTWAQKINSDSPGYADMYDQLNAEYEESLHETTTLRTSDSDKALDSSKGTDAESYSEATTRLKCNNPWFWNTFRCVWLDVREKKMSDRTRANAKVAGITIGIVSIFTVVPLCWCCIIALYFRSRFRKYAKLMDQYTTEYMPGSIILPSGEVKRYDPTPEEVEAFEDLILLLTSVV